MLKEVILSTALLVGILMLREEKRSESSRHR